ncbi:MAG: endonuclease domain-containing protein [Pseudomonadota bacterium]
MTTRYTHFIFESYHYAADTGTLSLNYAYQDGPSFCEEIVLPLPSGQLSASDRHILDRLFRLLFLLAGVSYYKAYAPLHLACQAFAIDPATAAFVEKLYRNGLAEFAFCNRITVGPRFTDTPCEPLKPLSRKTSKRVLVPIGGGKDSCVALECLRRSGHDTVLFALHSADGLAEPIKDTIRIAGLPVITTERRLDSGLTILTDAYNGHVPVTAILSVVALCSAVLQNLGAVVMANEHSANAPNLTQGDQDVNHQYSKSLEFEEDLDLYVKAYVCDNLTYVSLLRPLTEAAIAQKFTTLEAYHPVFCSCNTAFRQNAATRGKTWCNACPKCRFVFLAMAPFMDKQALIAIFGLNLLNNSEQEDGFAALCGLDTHKPFECVGETHESALLLLHLSALPDWQDDVVIKALTPRLSAHYPLSAIQFVDLFDMRTPHRVPYALLETLDAVG